MRILVWIVVVVQLVLLNFFGLGVLLLLFLLPPKTLKTERGMAELKKWLAFKRFIRDYSKIGEHGPLAVHLWEHYYVYAIVLDEAEKMDEISHIIIGTESSPRFTKNKINHSRLRDWQSTFEGVRINTNSSGRTGSGRSFSSGGRRGGGGGGRGGF